LHLLEITQNLQALESGYWWFGDVWASPDLFFIVGTSDGGSYHDLRYLNIETGNVFNLWAEVYEAYAVDIENGLVALSSAPSSLGLSEPTTGDGLYLLSLDGNRRKVSETIYWSLAFRGGIKSRFIGNDGKQIVSIAVDGTITPLLELTDDWWSVTRVSVSPDMRWFVLYNDAGKGLLLFSETDQLVSSWMDVKPSTILGGPTQMDCSLPMVINSTTYQFLMRCQL